MGPREILTAKFELVVTCSGANEANGSSLQVRVLQDFRLAFVSYESIAIILVLDSSVPIITLSIEWPTGITMNQCDQKRLPNV